METVKVVIAGTSLLARIGLSALLNQLGYPLSFREIIEPEKLRQSIQKENKSLVIISKSFLNNCSPELISNIKARSKSHILVLINDTTKGIASIRFNEVIEPSDLEKTISGKFEKLVQLLLKHKDISKSNAEISGREKEVLRLVALGLTNKEIAEMLFISMHTVITHRKNISSKLGIKTIAGLTVYAVINKLIKPDEIK
jgi:DNA-binding NarL/FixJ family response regulator